MKLKQYIKAACLFSFVAVTTSCMDLEPLSDLGDNLVWDNAANFQLFANQFYSWPHDFDRAVSDEPHSDYRSDLVAGSSMNVYSQGTNAIPATDANYTKLYKRIYYTNLLLKNAESFDVPADIIVPVAEAKFFRAYSHFELVQLYGDAIILTEPLDLDSEKLYGRRNDRGEVIDQVIKDLKDAVGGLPETSSEAGRLNKYIAYAMLSRVALYEGTWQKFHTNGKDATSNTSRSTELLTIAKDAANEVIKGGKYQLFYNEKLGNESYRYMFTLEDGAQCNPANLSKSDNTEYIFVKRHRNGDKTAWNLTHGMVANACYVTRKLANMYLCSDGLPIGKSSKFQQYAGVTDEFQNRDNRMGNNMLYHGQQYWNNDGKWRTTWTDADLTSSLTANVRSGSGYQNRKWGTERQVEDYYESYDFPVIRYAEVLLTYVEAENELNGPSAEIYDMLDQIRTRVGMPKVDQSKYGTKETLRELIRRERSIELAGEGLRRADILRWKDASGKMVAETVLNAPLESFTGTINYDEKDPYKRAVISGVELVENRSFAPHNRYLPIKQDALDKNKQLKQNDGY